MNADSVSNTHEGLEIKKNAIKKISPLGLLSDPVLPKFRNL